MRRLSPALIASVVIGSLALLPLLTGDRYQGRDHTFILLGATCALRDAPDEGLILDPALGGGSPLLADPSQGVLNPLSWLLRPFPPEVAASLYVVLLLAAAAASAAWLARRQGLGRRAALAVGLAWPLSGTVVDLILHGPFLVDAALLPAAWALAIGVARGAPRQRARDAPLLGLALGGLILGGDPQAFGFGVLLLLVELGAALWRARRRGARAPARFAWVLAVLLALGLGAAAVLPSMSLGATVDRARGVRADQISEWSLAPPEALDIAWPGIAHGRTRQGTTLARVWREDRRAQAPWNQTPHLGLVLLAAAALAFPFRRRLAAAAAAFGLMSLGAQTPVYPLALTLLPPLAYFRYPAKYFLPASLALLLLAAWSLSVGVRARLRRPLVVALGVALTLSLGAMLLVFLRAEAIDAAGARYALGTVVEPWVRPSLSGLLLSRGALASALAALGLGVLFHEGLRRRAALLLPLSLAPAAWLALPTGPPLLDEAIPRQEIGGPQDARVCHGKAIFAFRLDEPTRDLGRYGETIPAVQDLKTNVQQCGGPSVPNHYLPTAQATVVDLHHTHLDETRGVLGPAWALGCTHLMSRGQIPPEAEAALGPPLPNPYPFLAPTRPLRGTGPRALVVEAPVLHASEAEVLAAVVAARAPDEVVRHLDDPDGQAPAALSGGRGRARLEWRGSTLGRLEVEAEGPVVVVLDRPWWRGWVAAQGGQPLPVLRAAGVRLAVVVERPGDGPVELRYEAPGLAAGLGLGGLSLCALLAWLALSRRSAGARRPSGPSAA